LEELRKAIISKYVVISVMGPHANESEIGIFQRKREDVKRKGMTYWLIKSRKAKPPLVQGICKLARKEGSSIWCIFIEPSSPYGAKQTKCETPATHYSEDMIEWVPLPHGLGPVTGNLEGGGAYGLKFDQLDIVDRTVHLDLWGFSEFATQEKPIITGEGYSTVCAIKNDTSRHSDKMNSHIRAIVGLGRLAEPYCVYLR
jgi:hypothetical protein